MRELLASIVSVLAGAVIGWSGQALTLSGRVEAIEKQVSEIHQDLRTFINEGKHHEQTPPSSAWPQGPLPSPSQVR
jgi:hypothetical protein